MPSILSGFDSVQQALSAHQYALSLTQKNIANANNEAYTRQTAVFTPGMGDGLVQAQGVGVYLQAERDRFIDYNISQELQDLGESDVQYNALRQIDAIMGQSDGDGLDGAIADFFNSFGALSATPEDPILREKVLSSANALAGEFRSLYSRIQQVQASQDQAVAYAVDEVNSLTARIAALNEQVKYAQAAGTDELPTLRDSRQQLIEELSTLVGLTYSEDGTGSVTVTSKAGVPLVEGNDSNVMTAVAPAPGAFSQVWLDGTNITNVLQSGELAGRIDMRDGKIQGYLNSLDGLAAAISTAVNTQHAAGRILDLSANGGAVFAGTAATLNVLISDPALIAAAANTATGAGNNDNARALAALSDSAIASLGGRTFKQSYAGLVYRVGQDEATAEDGVTVQTGLINSLKNQRASLTAVNMDEEAISIIKFQKAYQASARYANTLETLSDEILQFLGG